MNALFVTWNTTKMIWYLSSVATKNTFSTLHALSSGLSKVKIRAQFAEHQSTQTSNSD